ncbi:MAG: glycosyltransferase [Bacteroidetes bacterium]|nr:glycosyltransferase [Bacteroidota bacterium]
MRNLFLKYAKYDYLLFLDCDAIITSKKFISNYITYIQKNKPKIICGGRIYDQHSPERKNVELEVWNKKRKQKPRGKNFICQ